jgi:hypothetical protein
LPNVFPPDAPVCQAAPGAIFNPTTEWAWVGIQIVADANPWNPGDLVRPCANAADTHCYREPCTNFFDGNNCYRSVESIPTTSDMDKDGVPEVAFKAYADNTFSGNHLLVIVDGRSDAALPSTSADPANPLDKTHRTKRVIYGETRGHLALGDIDGDSALEVVAVHANGVTPENGVNAYDPFSKSNPTGTNTANVNVWHTAAGYLNNSFSAAAPSLNDLNDDGVPEVVVGPMIIDAVTGATIFDTTTLGLAYWQNHTSGQTALTNSAPYGNSNPSGCGGYGGGRHQR